MVSAVKAEKKVNLLEPQTVSEVYLNLHTVHALSLENDMKRSVSGRDTFVLCYISPEAHTAATFGHRKNAFRKPCEGGGGSFISTTINGVTKETRLTEVTISTAKRCGVGCINFSL